MQNYCIKFEYRKKIFFSTENLLRLKLCVVSIEIYYLLNLSVNTMKTGCNTEKNYRCSNQNNLKS